MPGQAISYCLAFHLGQMGGNLSMGRLCTDMRQSQRGKRVEQSEYTERGIIQ